MQTKVHYKLVYSVRIEMTYKPSKVAAAKKLFSSVYVMDATCSDECFYSMWQQEDIKFLVTWRFFQPPFVAFFDASVLKEVRILRYLHSNSAVVILNFTEKAIL